MNEPEYTEILDRKKHTSDVQQHFGDQLKLLIDLVNYGSNLIPRAYTSSEKGLTEAIVIGVLLKQVIAMLDAAEILISNAAIHAAQLEARTAYEASVYLDWILNSDSEKRSKYYYVANLRQERIWANRAIKGTDERERFDASTGSLNIDVNATRPNLETEANSRLEQVNKILGREGFCEIDKEFETIRQKDRQKREPNWYRPLGLFSIRQMAKQAGRIAEYDIFYAKGSQVAHSASYKDHVRFENQGMTFKPIRYLENIDSLQNFLVSLTMKAYQSIIERYRPGELQAFFKKYIDDWRGPFMGIKPVRYKINENGRKQ